MLQIKSILFCVLLTVMSREISSLKILMFIVGYSPSHLRFSGSLAKILHESGHTVDKVVQFYNPSVKILEPQAIRKLYRIELNDTENPFLQMNHIKNPFLAHDHDFLRSSKQYYEAIGAFCEETIKDKAFTEKLRAEHYDIMLTSAYTKCPNGLAEILSIPSVIDFSPTPGADGAFESLGIPMPPSFIKNQFSPTKYYFGFMDRVKNFIRFTEDNFIYDFFAVEQRVFDKYYPNLPKLGKLMSQISYYMVNTDEIIDIVRPISPKIKYIGAVTASKDFKPLDEDFKKLLSIPSKGVVLMSFGSMVKTTQISAEKKAEIVKAFAEFSDYTFIWKYDTIKEDEKIFTNATNVHLRSWLPQIALLKLKLLGHPRVKLFITHMGQNSYYELSTAGVPAIAIPVFGDQYYNAGCAVHNGVAVEVDKVTFSKTTMVEALREVLGKESYAQKAKEISKMLAQKPDKIGAKEFVEHIEYAAAFPPLGPQLLQMASTELNPLQLYCIDVLLFLAVCSILVLALIFIVLRLCFKLVSNYTSNAQKKVL